MGVIKDLIDGITLVSNSIIKSTTIKKDLRDSFTKNIKLLDRMENLKINTIDELTPIVDRLDFTEINGYISFIPLYKLWICNTKATKDVIENLKAKRIENKTFEEILRNTILMLDDIKNNDVAPVMNMRVRLININKNLKVCRKLINKKI
jgi:hypothetical protein